MKWTTEKPTEPGWYWMKSNFRSPQMVELTYDFANRPHIVTSYNGTWGLDHPAMNDYHFSGPIPEPEQA